MTYLCPFNVHTRKWHVAYFVPIDGHFGRGGGGGGGVFTTLFYTIHKKRQKCSVIKSKKCNFSDIFVSQRVCFTPVLPLEYTM